MKKTTSITIGGIVLHIDEDAFDLLNNYINSLNRHFEKDPEKAEILNDIEQRLAELLSEQLPDKGYSVKKEYVENAIRTMGTPQDFENENSDTTATTTEKEKKTKQLYRNPEGKIFGGVCGGIAVYFAIDPTLIRITFVILTLFGAGFPIPLYIILWIIIPEAQTRTQKMEMKGESINIDSIKKNAQAGFEDIKSSVSDFAHSKNTQQAVSQIGVFIGKVAPIFFRVAFGLSIAAITIAIICLSTLEFSSNIINWGLPPTIDPELLFFLHKVDVHLFAIGILLVTTAAVISLFYILPNIIWGEKRYSRVATQITSVLTTIGIIVIIIALTKSIVDYQAIKEFLFYGATQ